MYPLRIGEVVGIHAVNISIATPILILRHETQSRALFAEGTLCAAEFLAEQEPGLYNMKSMI